MRLSQDVDEKCVVFLQPLERRIEDAFQIWLLVKRLEIADQKVLGQSS